MIGRIEICRHGILGVCGLVLGLFLTHPQPLQAQSVSATPDQVVAGTFGQPSDCFTGYYRLRRVADRVALSVHVTRLPAPGWRPCGSPPVLFTVPPGFRPPFSQLREIALQLLPTAAPRDATSAAGDWPRYVPESRGRLQIEPYGTVRYWDVPREIFTYRGAPPIAGANDVVFLLHTQWGVTPVANDSAVLEILGQAWRADHSLGWKPEATNLSAEGRVTTLRWESNSNMRGSLVPELAQLTALTHLDLSGGEGRGSLGGEIPPELGQLIHLTHLDLGDQHLSGTIPPELGQLAALQYLSLRGDEDTRPNDLHGTIPPELGQLTQLTHLDLSSNGLEGAVPPELGQLTQLTYLALRGTQLRGRLPLDLSGLTRLTHLDLSGNRIQILPPELGQLTRLTRLPDPPDPPEP